MGKPATRLRPRTPEIIIEGDHTISPLEIPERGTIGMVGLEAVRNEQDERRWPGEPPKAYIAHARAKNCQQLGSRAAKR